MKITLTAKLKLTTTPEQFAALRATQLAYRDALNQVSCYAFAHGKTGSSRRLQRALYREVRSQFGVPAQMACSVFRQVGATYRGLWTKWHKNQDARRHGFTTRRFKGLDTAPHFVSPTLTYVLGRDYTLKTRQRVSLRTLAGRVEVPYQGWKRHVGLLRQTTELGEAKLWYDRGGKKFYLLVALTLETPDSASGAYQQVGGIDVGQRYLAAVTTTQGQCQFYSGKEIRQKTDHVARLQKRLRAKGTRSATRKRIALARRERRLKQQTNHVISKQILETHPHSFMGMEDLTDIRERTKRRKYRRRGKHFLPVPAKARKANRHASKWAFAELQAFLSYKARLAGSLCIKVDADYTSQRCPRCGYTAKANRPEKGLLFVCRQCQHTLHADLVGARNIALRTLLIRQDWVRTGLLSVGPDVSDREAKAARLQRYAELRWSLDTSSPPSGGE
jgi:IS605 OrfB family transposase